MADFDYESLLERARGEYSYGYFLKTQVEVTPSSNFD